MSWTDELVARFAAACDLRQQVDQPAIAASLGRWLRNVGVGGLPVRFLANADGVREAARAAWAERAAWSARISRTARAAWSARISRASRAAWAARISRASRAAWAAWAAWAVRSARDVWGAWDAWDARDASDAWSAWSAWSAWASRAAWDVSWSAIAAIGFADSGEIDQARRWLPMLEAFEAGAWAVWLTDSHAAVAVLPSRVALDGRQRLHCEIGPAFSWLDVNDHYWHGVHVPAHIIEHPETITPDHIDGEPNVEIRRVMIERFGQERYLLAGDIKPVHVDDWGTLYRKAMPGGDEDLVMVKVVNATRDPDGTFRDYFLRVPPEMRTAREAVAWTFGQPPEFYDPVVET